MNNLRALAICVLCNARQFKWTVQGLGMLRMHITPDIRLHIWHSSLRVANVSDIHNHLQWHFRSTVISGQLKNIRFKRYNTIDEASGHYIEAFFSARIKAGVGGGIEAYTGIANLEVTSQEMYYPGEIYTQTASEIHRSLAQDGTVTLVEKTPTDDKDGADVFWPRGNWVSAEPREATEKEVDFVTQYALGGLTGGRLPVRNADTINHVQV